MPTKKQLREADRLAKTVDWAKYEAMSDEEIRAHWAWDKDMTWPTDKELREFDLVIPAKSRREMARRSKRPVSSRGVRKPPAADKRVTKRRRKAHIAAE